jgi:hypothetical protein
MNSIPDVPGELIEAVKSGRCGVFVGAGLSVAAGYPSWEDLLKNLIDRAYKQKIIDTKKKKELLALARAHGKWLMVAQEISDSYGQPQFHNELGLMFEAVGAAPTDAHKLITEINFRFVVTTNYDQLIETAYLPRLHRIPKIFTHPDTADFADSLWKEEFFILKAHGDLQRKSTIILTEKDYRSLSYSSPGYRALLAAIFTTKTIFFVGASLNDPEIQLLLRSLHDAFQGAGQHHFALIANSDFSNTEAAHWRKNYNVDCIRYEPSRHHPELVAFLDNLRKATA